MSLWLRKPPQDLLAQVHITLETMSTRGLTLTRPRSASPANYLYEVHRSDPPNVRLTPKQCRKAKRIRFYRNGDRFYKGVVMAVTPERYRSFDSLVVDLTRAFADNVNLPSGVRIVFTMDGRKVSCLDDLEDGKCYVCSGFGESFKRINYGVNEMHVKLKRRSVSAMTGSVSPRALSYSSNFGPRLITIVRNGTRPRRVVRVLLNKRNAPSFDHALSAITDAVKLDSGAVRKVFSQEGTQLTRLEDFFGKNLIFFAYGAERFHREDFDLEPEECKAIEAQSKGPSAYRRLFDKPKMPSKTCQNLMIMGPSSVPASISIKYEIGPVIGDGNFAVVRQCVNRATGVEYALKIIDKWKCRGKEQMIDSEVSILRRVRHPNIIRLYLEQDSPLELYLVMELVKGGDLFDAISLASKFSEEESSIMIGNVASALFYLHLRHIVHRDIKPENLLVCVDQFGCKTLKLGDFGLAQKVTEPLFTVCGTPTYVAPEILSETGYGLKIDVWAAGVILFILLCGYPPFVTANNNQEELFDAILTGRYEFTSPYWDDISEAAKDLIAHLLQVQPECRFSAEDVLDHHWLAVSGGIEQLTVLRSSNLQQHTSSSPDLPALTHK